MKKEHKHHPILPGVLRFLGFWAGISGGYLTIGSTCPCCGKPGCPVGFGVAAFFGALGSFMVIKGKDIVSRLLRKRGTSL